MGPSVEQQLVRELEEALAQQQAAVSEGHASIRDTIREMQDALRELELRETALTETTSKLGGETVDRLKAFHTALSKSGDAGQAAVKELESTRARLAALEEHAGNVPALKDQLVALEEQNATLQQEVERQAALLLEAEKAHKRLRKLEHAYKDQSDALQAGQAARRHAAELETTVEEYKQAAHAEQQRVAELKNELERARANEAGLAQRIAEIESQDSQRAVEELEESKSLLDEAAKQLAALQTDLDNARAENSRLEKNLGELDGEVAAQGEAFDELRERVDALESDKTTLAAELEQLRTRSRDTADSERKLRAQFEQAESELNVARDVVQRVEELELAHRKLSDENSALKRKSAKLEQDLQNERAKGTKSQLATQLAEALREREAAEETIRSLREELDSRVRPQESHPEPKAELDAGAEEEIFVPDDASLTDAKRLLGDILVDARIVSSEQLESALSVQQGERPARRLGEVLVSMGYTHEVEVAQALARQRGLKYLTLEPKSIDRDAAHLISGRLAEMHMCIPVREHRGELILAMENPLDLIAIEDVERASERRVRPAVATISAIQAAISRIYAHDRQRA
jgi:DNA repair exonuclease SbcCD ATPase subunit